MLKWKIIIVVMMGIFLLSSLEAHAQWRERARDRISDTRENVRERAGESRRSIEDRSRHIRERASEERDRARRQSEQMRRNAEERARQEAQRAREARERTQRAAQERTRQELQRMQQSTQKAREQVQRRVQENSSGFSQRARDAGQRFIESEASQNLRDITRQAASHAETRLNNPENRQALAERVASIGYNASLATLRKVPVYDDSLNRFVTFDTLMRNMVHEMGGTNMQGSDLYDDPVAAGFALMFDSNAFETVRIIQHPSTGEWLSMNEAMHSYNSVNAPPQLRRTAYAYESTRLSHRLNYHNGFGRASAKLVEQLDPDISVNNKDENHQIANIAVAASANLFDTKLILASFTSRIHERLTAFYEEVGISEAKAPDTASATLIFFAGGIIFFTFVRFSRRRHLLKQIDALEKKVLASKLHQEGDEDIYDEPEPQETGKILKQKNGEWCHNCGKKNAHDEFICTNCQSFLR